MFWNMCPERLWRNSKVSDVDSVQAAHKSDMFDFHNNENNAL
jgi:hypothetical protein